MSEQKLEKLEGFCVYSNLAKVFKIRGTCADDRLRFTSISTTKLEIFPRKNVVIHKKKEIDCIYVTA